MSQENVEIVRRVLDAFNQRASDRTTEGDRSVFDPDVVLDTTTSAFDGGVYHGHDGLREGLSQVLGMWERQHYEPQEFIPVGESHVVVPIRIVSVGRDEIETVAHAALVYTLSNGRITHLKTFQSKADALKALRLAE
jgi:ketosteroid isomerase-like protein